MSNVPVGRMYRTTAPLPATGVRAWWEDTAWAGRISRRAAESAAPPLAGLLAFQFYRAFALTGGSSGPAHAHARMLLALERTLHMPSEAVLQSRVGQSSAGLLAWVYTNANLSVLIAVLTALSLVRPVQGWRLLRLAVLSTAAALTLRHLIPVAPPRFAEGGVRDLVGGAFNEHAWAHMSGFNVYAAFPSVHVLWAALAGAGIYLAGGAGRRRWLGLVWPLAMCLIVVATGNHYLLDCLGSLAVLACCAFLESIWWRGSKRRQLARDTISREDMNTAA